MDTRSLGVDWDGLERLVEQSDMPHRDTVLHILRHTPEWVLTNGVVTDSRKRQLGMLAGGSPWRYMERHFFPSLRCSHLRVYTDGPLQVATDGAAIPCPVQDTIYIERECVRTLVERDTSYVYSLYMAVKTNLLYDALLVPNLALEFYLGNRWSLSGGWMYAWWKNDTRHRYWRIYGGELELRRYFGRKAEEKPLTGHHLGIYLQGLTYDFEWGGEGYLSHWTYGAGISYGYSLPVARRFNLDFGLGVGYLGGTYDTYIPTETCYAWQRRSRRHWFGPTKAEITLVWLLGRNNYNIRKGGRR